MRRHLRLVALLVPVAIGCAKLPELDGASKSLPAPRMSSDSVGLEIVFLRVPADRELDARTVWSEVDEQRLPVETRRRLSANGFRCGKLGSQIPDTLRELLNQEANTAIDDAISVRRDGVSYQTRFLQSRASGRSQIVASKTAEELVVLMDDGDYRRGETFENGRCLFALRTRPSPNGGVSVELVPEIEFGRPMHQFIGHDGSFELDTGMQRKVIDELSMKMELAPGQSILLASTPELKGLGKHFFSEENESGRQRRLLLIRLAQTQLDDLFDPNPISPPLVTPSPGATIGD